VVGRYSLKHVARFCLPLGPGASNNQGMEPNPYEAPKSVNDSQPRPRALVTPWIVTFLPVVTGALFLMGAAHDFANGRAWIGGFAFGLLFLIGGCASVWEPRRRTHG
jgi:hypothetical protein